MDMEFDIQCLQYMALESTIACDPEDYGLPDEKKYPMPDKKHVLLAIKFFNSTEDPEKQKILAANINKRIKDFNMESEVNVGDKNRFKKYWKPSNEAVITSVSPIVPYTKPALKKAESVDDPLLMRFPVKKKKGLMVANESIFNSSMILYHGSGELYDVLEPVALDLGNMLQKPGWSLFCFKKKEYATSWALMRALHKLVHEMKRRNTSVSAYDDYFSWSKNGYCVINRGKLGELKKFMRQLSTQGFVYTITVNRENVSFGNDSSHPEYTVRENHIKPSHIQEIKLNMTNIENHCRILNESDYLDFKLQMINDWDWMSRGLVSLLMVNDWSYNMIVNEPAIRKIRGDISSGILKPGDDIEKYISDNHVSLAQLKPMKRIKYKLMGMDKSITTESITMDSDQFSITKSKNKYLIKDENGKKIAELGYYDYSKKDFNWILFADIETDKAHRNQGLGSKLLNRAYSDVIKDNPKNGVYLMVRPDNKVAISFYKKNGFEFVKSIKLKDGNYDLMCMGNADKNQLINMNYA